MVFSFNLEPEPLLKLRLEHDKVLREIMRLKKELADQSHAYNALVASHDSNINHLREENAGIQHELTESRLFGRRVEDSVALKTSQVEDLEKQTVSLQEELQQVRNESETLKTSNVHLQHEVDSLIAVVIEAEKAQREASDALIVANDKIVAFSQIFSEKDIHINILAQSKMTYLNELENLRPKLVNLELMASKHEKEAQAKAEECARFMEDLQKKDFDIASVQSKLEKAQRSYENLEVEHLQAQAKISALSLDFSRMTDELSQKETEQELLLSEIAKLQGDLASTRDDKNRLEVELGELDHEKQSLGNALQQIDQELLAAKELFDSERQVKEELEANIAGYVEKCRAFEEDIRLLEASEQKNEQIVANMRLGLERLRESQLQILKDVEYMVRISNFLIILH